MIKTCENCNEEWNASRSSKRFCGTECAKEARAVKPKVCLREGCGTTFTPERTAQIYCSKSCAATVNNFKYPKRRSEGWVQRYCFCGKPLSIRQRNHCSQEHSTLYYKAHNINDWLSGEADGGYGGTGQLKTLFRKYLIEMAGNKCTRCGWGEPNPVTGKPILCIDHIDGNWKNNSVDNLVVLCYNCHTLTPTFNGLNIGNGAGQRGSGNREYPDYDFI